MGDDRTPDMALLPGERAMSAAEWAEYGGLPPALKAYCHRLLREEAEARTLQRIDALEAAEWQARAMRVMDRLGAAEQRAEVAEAEVQDLEQRAEALAAEVAQARAEGFASGIHAAAEVLARRADAMSASGHHGYAYEVREVRLVVLEVLAEAQPAGEVSDG